MKVILAKNIGFCFGVKRALDLVEDAISRELKPLYLLAPLVHNEKVTEGLLKKGLKIEGVVEKIPKGARVVISAHGIGPQIKQKLTARRISIIDTTCPKIIKVQRLARAAWQNKRRVIIFGDKSHSEVKALKGYTQNQAKVISSIGDLKNLNLNKSEKTTLVAQTTQSEEDFTKIADFCKKHFPHTKVYQTICPEILARFDEVKKLAKTCDLLLVVGSRTSANTTRLFKLAKNLNRNTVWIDSLKKQLKNYLTKDNVRIGIVSGASTPLATINRLCKSLGVNPNNMTPDGTIKN